MMVPWWIIPVSCVAFALWTLLCIIVGAGVAMNGYKQQEKKKQQNAKLN